MRKKILSVLLAFAMLVCSIPLSAAASDDAAADIVAIDAGGGTGGSGTGTGGSGTGTGGSGTGTGGSGTGTDSIPGAGLMKRVIGRVFSELSAYCISEDVPVLSDIFYYGFCGPSQRAAMQERAMIQQIYTTVTEIDTKVTESLTKLDALMQQIEKGLNKQNYSDAYNNVKSQRNVYDSAWDSYLKITELETQMADLDDQLNGDDAASLTDAEKTALTREYNAVVSELETEITAFITSYEKSVNDKTYATIGDVKTDADADSVIAACKSQFDTKINTLDSYVSDATNGYLTSLVSYLRTYYPFEHQMTQDLYDGYAYIDEIETQMYLVHMTYMQFAALQSYCVTNSITFYDTTANKVNLSGILALESLDETIFTKILSAQSNKSCTDYAELMGDTLETYLTAQINATGVADMMISKVGYIEERYSETGGDLTSISESLTELETEVASEIENGEASPQFVEVSKSIGGTVQDCYLVRDNADLNYYLITTKPESMKEQISHWQDLLTMEVWCPTDLIGSVYTDDGNYKLLASLSDFEALDNFDGNLLANLRAQLDIDSTLKFSGTIPDNISTLINYGLPQDDQVGYFLLNTFTSNAGDWNADWTFKGVSATSYNHADANPTTFDSEKIFDGDEGSSATFLRIYKCVNYDSLFADGTYYTTDPDQIPSCIALHDGQTLDLSGLKSSPSALTIVVGGDAKIIGSTSNQIKNVKIIVSTSGTLTLENVNIAAQPYNSAIEVTAKDANIVLSGECKINGTTNTTFDREGAHDYVYESTDPIGVSPAMTVEEGASLTLTGAKGIFTGTQGGAGIYVLGDLTVRDAEIEAYGSTALLYEGDNILSASGAGIGGCVGGGFASYRDTLDVCGQAAGTLTIADSTVTAKGGKKESKYNYTYAEDIGAAYTTSEATEAFAAKLKSGKITNSTIDAQNVLIQSDIDVSDDGNYFLHDRFTVTIDNPKDDGTTDSDGIDIRLIGSVGTTEWKRTDATHDSGETSFTFTGDSIGTVINSIEFQVPGDESCYVQYVKVETALSKVDQTIYVGKLMQPGQAYSAGKDDSVIKVTIKTADEKNAGTDSDVYMKLMSADGRRASDELKISSLSYSSNALEKGDKDVIYVNIASNFDPFGALPEHIWIKSSHTNTSPDWKIEYISMDGVQGNAAGYSEKISANQWVCTSTPETFGVNSGATGTFQFTIKTKDIKKAGTDADIYATLYGTDGETGEINLSDFVGSYTSGNNFERGDTDYVQVTFETNGIGEITELKLRNSGGGTGSDWDVDSVTVTEVVADGHTAQTAYFSFDCEIASKKSKTVKKSGYQSVQATSSDAVTITADDLTSFRIADYDEFYIETNRKITITADALAYVRETGTKIHLVMKKGDVKLYDVTFDGSLLGENVSDLTFNNGISKDGSVVTLNFFEGDFSESGVSFMTYLTSLGIDEDALLTIYQKLADGEISEIDFTKIDDIVEYLQINGGDIVIDFDDSNVVLYGDADENGAVEADDALLALQSVVKLETLSDSRTERGDVDGSGTVTATDALYILQRVVALIDEFPIEK